VDDGDERLEDLKGMYGAAAVMSGLFHTLVQVHAGEMVLPDDVPWERLVESFDCQRDLLREGLRRLLEREIRELDG
jgi:hypothetical protein